MTSVKAWRMQIASPAPNIQPYLVEASQDIRAGDFVQLKQDIQATRVIKLTGALSATNIILGIAWHSIKTDANGNLIPNTLSTIDPGAIVTYPVPSYGGLVDRPAGNFTGTTPDIGSARLAVCLISPNLELFMDACGAANAAVTINMTQLGKAVGLQAVTNDTKADFSASGAATGLVVTAVGEREPNYNVSANFSNGVWLA